MQGSVKIEIDVQKVDFSKATQEVNRFARDTGKALDPIKRTKLEMDVANATLNLQKLRNDLRNFQGTITQKKQLIIDTNNAQSQLTEAKRKLQNFKNTGDESVSRLQTKFNQLGNSIKDTFSRFVSITAIVAGVASVGRAVVTLAGNLEQAKISFTTMLGSAEKADKLLRDLSDFAKKTPFNITGIRDNAKQLLAMGISLDKIIPTTKMLGDVASGLSVPLDRLVLAYGQVIAKGKLQGGELKQFTEAGVPLIETLSEKLGVTSAKFYELVSAGKITSEQVTQAFEIMTSEGGKFANLMEAQSSTLQGTWSNLIDGLSLLGEKIGTFFLPVLKGLVSILNLIVSGGDKTAESIGELNKQFEYGTISGEEYVKVNSELTKKISDNRKALEELTKKYTFGLISLTDYLDESERLRKEYDKLTSGTNETSKATDILTGLITDFYNNNGDTKAKRAELEKLRQKILETIDAQILLAETDIYREKASKTQGQGSMAGMYGELIDDIKLGGEESDKLLNKLEALKAKKKEITTAKQADINKILDDDDAGGSKTNKGLEKAKNDIKTIDDALKNNKREEYQKDVENTIKEINKLKDSAINDIDDINRKLAELQQGGSNELAKRYAEVVKELAGSGLDDTERNKLIEEKLFLEGKVSEELRNQAVEYSKLSEAQKIYKNNQKEIEDLTERQNIDKAFLGGKLTTTSEGGIGIQDEKDPSKIIAITNLKNQQYALDLVNQEQKLTKELEIKKQMFDDEAKEFSDLTKRKLEIEQQYTKDFAVEINQQKALIQSLLDMQAKLSRRIGGSSSSTPSGNSTSNTLNMNLQSSIDVKSVTSAVQKQFTSSTR